MSVLRITPARPRSGRRPPGRDRRLLNRAARWLAAVPVATLLALLDDFAGRLLRDDRTKPLEGIMFLSAWLRRSNLQSSWN